jgi:16S rRNA (adenine1518-N6/adenine1519-N6)-dimethyltransferase
VTPSEITELLTRHGVRPSKALGQNFLADENTARRIVRLAELQPGDRVVEVGPGIGSLTVALADAGAHVCAVELDRHLVPILEEVVAERDVEVINDDALRVDWSALLDPEHAWAMVANLPYNVATSVVIRALETAPMIRRALVMVQREVGERLAAGVGDDAYGAVSVKIAYYASAKVVGTVSPNVFIPKP